MELIKSFKALSDKTRLRLLYILQQYELNVNEIVMVVDMIQSGVSRHLKILEGAGLVTSRRDGSFTYYSAVENRVVKPLIDLVVQGFENDPKAVQDLETSQEMIKLRKNRTQRFFKTIAPQWDRVKKEVFGDFDLNAVIIKKIINHGRFADLGCGTGELIECLAGVGFESFIGIDSSPEMLDQARIKLAKISNAELRLGELEHLPMKNKEIDTVVMNMVLHHISQPRVPIEEVNRVLKPGGIFILSDFETHRFEQIKEILGSAWLGFEKEQIKAWLTDAGLQFNTMDSYTVHHDLTINIFTANKP